MSEHPYQFAVLRYVHDPMTQEVLNIGVVVYSREPPYLRMQANTRYGRLSRAFLSVDGEMYRRMVDHVKNRLRWLEEQLQGAGMFDEAPRRLEDLLQQVLPSENAGLVFDGYGAGLAENLNAALASLCERLVNKYTDKEDLPSRTDDEIWHVYKEHLDRANVTPRLNSNVTIHAPNYDFEFLRAWKNERWHPVQPISFDLMLGRSILEKANTWIGRAAMLSDSDEIGTLYLLVGGPHEDELQESYRKAIRNLHDKMALDHQIVEEDQAAAFSGRLAELIDSH